MKMIRAIIRPEKVDKVADELSATHPALTKMHVFGKGQEGGIKVGEVVYDELPKTMLMVVVDDGDCSNIVEKIIGAARTGSMGDGKIFVTDVDEAYTIRTGEKGVGVIK